MHRSILTRKDRQLTTYAESSPKLRKILMHIKNEMLIKRKGPNHVKHNSQSLRKKNNGKALRCLGVSFTLTNN